ncbi:MAG: hypothetical protein K2P37_06400 [Oscillospiraceae bacterium]|nr:hypothetical protein [Oscillospiraceae bacterium]
MKIKNGMEQAYANFTVEQQASENGWALLNFVEAWSGMMEYAVSLGWDHITPLAELTVRPAAVSAGITDDSCIEVGAAQMVKCWAYGEELTEWSIFHPPEILSEDRQQDLWEMSPQMLDILPELVQAYPCIQDACPDILEQRQRAMEAQADISYPQMSM